MSDDKPETPARSCGFLCFLASGSVWFGLFAFVLFLTAVSSCVFGWKKVTTSYSGRQVDRIELRVNFENGGGSGDLATLLLLATEGIAALGFLLGVVSVVSVLVARRRVWAALLGLLLSLLAAASPFIYFFLASRFGWPT